MKNLRRVLALVVVFAMVLGCTAAMAAPKFTDLNDNDQQVVGVLAHLNLIQGYEEADGTYTFRGDQTITRAEFAAIVARMLGMESTAKTQVPTQFSDVPQSHWASGYVAAASGKNIIVGYGDGTFGPENPVKYEEAVKMLVCALGYEPQAAEEGGYPTGHLFVAQRINLLSGANGYAGVDATRLTVATLSYNALDIPLMERSTWGGTPVYEIYDGTNGLARKTLMSEYLNLIKLSGVVKENENSSTSLEGLISVTIKDNYSTKYNADTRYKIGNTPDFKVGDTNAKDFIGTSVVMYVTYESNKSVDPTVIFIEAETNKDKITLDIDNLKEASDSASDTVAVTYYTDKDNNKTSKLFIPAGDTAVVFVNGVKITDYTGETFMNDINDGNFDLLSGSIEFVSTDSKGAADYNSIFITVYSNFLVDSVNTSLYKILPADESPYGKNISFDPADRDIITTIKDANGATVDPKDLQQYDVLSIKMSYDGGAFPFNLERASQKDVFDCTLVRKTITGTVTELDPSDPDVAVIDGTEYKLDPTAVDNDSLSLKMQDSGTFYLDAIGKIVAFNIEIGEQAGNYAVLLYTDAGDGINSPRVKLLMPDGKIVTKYLASKVKNPVYTAGASNPYGSVQTDNKDFVASIAGNLGMACTYKENSSNQISSLYFSLSQETAADGGMKQYDKEVYNAGHLMTNINKAADGKIIAENTTEKSLRANSRTVWFDKSTIVINIDNSTKTFENISESEVTVWDVSTLTYDQDLATTGAKVSVYDMNSSQQARFVVIYGNAPVSDPTRAVALIKSVRTTQNADGDDITKLNAYTTAESNTVPYSLSTDCEVLGADELDLVAGTAFVPTAFTTSNEVKKLEILTVADFTDGTVAPTATLLAKRIANDVEYFYGSITRKSGSTITIADEISGAEQSRIIGSNVSVLECDLSLPADNAVKLRTIADVEWDRKEDKPLDEDVSDYKVLIRVYKGNVDDVVLYIVPAAN